MKQIPHRSVYKCLVIIGLIANLAVGYRSAAQTTGYGVAQEVWLGLSTNEFGFELGADFLSKVPNTNRIQLNFSVGSTVNGYAQRLRGFVLPPITGPYTFAVAADDWAELYLSSDETPGNRQRIAFTPSPSGLKNFEAFPSQRSAPITLLSGRRYYIEAIHREGTGADYIDVQWLIPDDTLESPIPGRATGKPGRLIPFRTNAVAVPGFFVQPPPTLSVLEGRPAFISLLSSNQSPLVYQWLEDGVEIAGANQPVLELSAATQAANGGKKYRCRVTSEAGSTLSGETLLTITPDTIRPAVISVASIGTDGLLVSFSETVRPPAATQFSIDGVQILGAQVTLDPSQVRLRTTAMTLGASYSLRINGVQDLAGLETEPGAAFAFQVRNSYTTSVGATNSLGTVTTVGSNGYDVTATGRDIAGRTDQFLFEWMLVRGNFDYQVRVESFSLVELLSKGGLMARDDLSSTGRYAAVFATPSINGTIFQSRNAAGKDATVAGLTPVNYPHTWLRLQRQGNVFTGHASTDGRNWSPVSSANILMPEFVYLGLSASSRTTNGQPTSVKFRDFADATGQSLGQVKPSDREPPGPSSRRSGLTISEIMYRPAERPDRRSLEFVEIFNSQPYFEDLSGHRLSGDIDYTFPTNTILPGGGYLVIAKSPADMEFAYGLRGVLGPYSNNIPNDLGTLRLRNELGAILLEVEYESQDPWPIAADGTGHSIVLARPSYGELRHHGWDASDVKGGSPGTMDGVGYEPARGVKINEIMANPGIGQTDFVELFNTTAAEIDLSGAFLSDSPSTNKFQIPPGTRIPARGRVSFTEAELGFGLSSGGETLFLVNASNTRVIDAVRIFGSSRGVSQGRSPDGEGPLHELTTSTPGTANSGRLRRDIVINEIMYAPVSGDNDDEFIELYNRGNQDVSLAGWRIANGVSFNFP
ncbi:MAG: hypothetical protein FJ405_08220, partial [Verrucomicrobia bacterium]|nr:hypothetical protein [Verrucomicrobiota bacterium]